MNYKKRIMSVDILRTFAIINSIVLHVYLRFNLVNYTTPFRIINSYIFKVGTVFIFFSGMMTYLIYLPQYKENHSKTTKKLFKKGLFLLILYFVLINGLRITRDLEIPANVFDNLYYHPFFMKVLLTFSFVYIMAPLFLFLLCKFKRPYFLIFLAGIFLLASEVLPGLSILPDPINILFFDQSAFLYAIVPMLAVYCLGILLGIYYRHTPKSDFFMKISIVLFLTIGGCSLLFGLTPALIMSSSFMLVHEVSLLVLLFIIVDLFASKIKNIKLNKYCFPLIVGEVSLVAYISANIFIGLLPNLSVSASDIIKIAILFSAILIAYITSFVYKRLRLSLGGVNFVSHNQGINFYIYFFLGAYVLLALCLFFLIYPEKRTVTQSRDLYQTKANEYILKDGSVPGGSYIFIGDSLIENLNVSAIATPSVNYGIAGDTTNGTMNRIKKYNSIDSSSAVILLVGINDIFAGNEKKVIVNYELILNELNEAKVILLNPILPIDSKKIANQSINPKIMNINSSLKNLCGKKNNCYYLDDYFNFTDAGGDLKEGYSAKDGLHLSSRGYSVLITNIKNALLETAF